VWETFRTGNNQLEGVKMIDGLAGITVGAVTTVSMFAAASLDGSTISVEAAVGVVVFISGLVWWMSAKFQRMDDRLQNIERALQNCPQNKNGICEAED
jgi:hypothetical protein